MKKRNSLIVLAFLVIIVGTIIYRANSSPNGTTIEDREKLLEDAIGRGTDWNIAKEIQIDEYIISAAYSADGISSIAVFEPRFNGKYKFSTSTNRDSEDIIIGGAIINGDWYDLVWFNGAQTEYAEITYIIDGNENEPLRYDTTDMDIIYNKNFQKEYSMEVCYYDVEGNKYE